MPEHKCPNNVQVSEAKAAPMHFAGISLLVLLLTVSHGRTSGGLVSKGILIIINNYFVLIMQYVGVLCGLDFTDKVSVPTFQERIGNKTSRRVVIKATDFKHPQFEVHSISKELNLGVIHLSDENFDVSGLLSELSGHPSTCSATDYCTI